MATSKKRTSKRHPARRTRQAKTLLELTNGICDDKDTREAAAKKTKRSALTGANKAAKKNNSKNSATTKTVTINGRKVKVTEKRSSRFNGKNERVQKKCSVCGKWQPIDLYSRPDRDCRCKECNSSYAKDLKERNAANTKPKKATASKAKSKKATPKKTTKRTTRKKTK